MKRLISLLLLIPTIGWAQEQPKQPQPKMLFTQAPCSPAPQMFETIKNYNEELLFIGDGTIFGARGMPYRGGLMFFTNQESGTYSIVKVFADGIACLISNGTGFAPYSGTQPYGPNKDKL